MEKVSYLGGLVTGEGCFCFAVRRRRNRLQIAPIFCMFMADRETIDFASDALTELGLPVYLQERPKSGRNQYGIHISGLLRVERYCRMLLPHLTGQKRQAASITLEFIESRLQQKKGAPYTDRELDLVRQLRETNGNTRGRKNPL